MGKILKEKDFVGTARLRNETILYNVTNVVLGGFIMYAAATRNHNTCKSFERNLDEMDKTLGATYGENRGVITDPNGALARKNFITILCSPAFDTNIFSAINTYASGLHGVTGLLQTMVIFSGAKKRFVALEKLITKLSELPMTNRLSIINSFLIEFGKWEGKFNITVMKDYLSELGYKIFETWYNQQCLESNEGIFEHDPEVEIPDDDFTHIDTYFVETYNYPEGYALMPFNSKLIAIDIDSQNKYLKFVKTKSMMKNNYTQVNHSYMLTILMIGLMYKYQRDYRNFVSEQLSGVYLYDGSISPSVLSKNASIDEILTGTEDDVLNLRVFENEFPELQRSVLKSSLETYNRPYEMQFDAMISDAIKYAGLEINDKGMFSKIPTSSTVKSVVDVKAATHRNDYIKVSCAFYSFLLQLIIECNTLVYTDVMDMANVRETLANAASENRSLKSINETLNQKVSSLSNTLSSVKQEKAEFAISGIDKEEYEYTKLIDSMQAQLEELELKLAKAERKNQRYAEKYGSEYSDDEADSVTEEIEVPFEEKEALIRSKTIVIYTGIGIPRISEELGIIQNVVEKNDNINTRISEDIKCDVIGIYTRCISHKATFRVKSIAERKGFPFLNLNCTNYNRVVNAIYDVIKENEINEV